MAVTPRLEVARRPKRRPPWSKTLKTGHSGRSGLRFELHDVSHGASRRADAPVGECSHERIRVWGMVARMWSCRVRIPLTGLAPGKTHAHNKIPEANASGIAGGSDRRRSGDLSIFSRTLYQLSYRARTETYWPGLATPTGLEPATSAVTGRRANQLRYGALQQVRPIELFQSRLRPVVPPTGFEPVSPP